MLNYAENILHKQKRKNKYDSIKRSKQTVIDLAMCNPQLNVFMTLTFSEQKYADYNLAYDEFRKFRNRLNTYMKRNFNCNFNYIATFETTKKGRWHVHMLCDLNYRLFGFDEVESWYLKDKIKSDDKKKIENFFADKFWKNGFIDFTELENSEGSAYYLIKYLSKEIDTENIGVEENIKRRFLTSKGLNRPLVIHVRLNDNKEKINALEEQLKNINKKDYKIKTNVYNDFTLIQNDFQPRIVTETVYLKNVKLSNIK